jgi:long-chain acyl-CoA synthetase
MQVIDGGAIGRELRPVIAELKGLESGGYVQAGHEKEYMGWNEVRTIAAHWAGALQGAGIKPGDRVAILGETSRDWMIANHAIHLRGAIVVPIYPTLQADVVSHIIKDSGAKVAICDADQKPKLKGQKCKIWTFDSLPEGDAAGDVEVSLDDPALLIYTSGTTGVPKGVLLDHRNLSGDANAAVEAAWLDRVENPSLVAFLPLAHIAGYVSLHALLLVDGTVYFSRPDRMGIDLERYKPTIALAVPRLWERIIRKVEETVAEGPAIRQKLFARAKATAMQYGEASDARGKPGLGLRLRHGFYGRLVYRKLLAKIGMDKVKVAVTGAAAVRPDLLWYLRGIGLPIIEGYGMTESSALTTCTRVDDWRAGTVGTPLPGCKIALADDGEVLIGGIGVFTEYWNLPAETDETRVMIDGEAWIRSGDLGEIRHGCLAIVDRKKELEVLDTGKMIAPVRVEELLKSESNLVEDSCLIGTDRSFAGILIQPAYDALLSWAAKNAVQAGKVVRKRAPTGEEQTYSVSLEFLQNPKIRAVFQKAVDGVNARVADYERVRTFQLVPDAFTIDRGELTPSFKKKRKAIVANHKALVEALFTRRAA